MAAYLRCGGVVNYQIKKGLFLSLSVEMFFKSLNRLFGNVTSKSVAVSRIFFRPTNALQKDEESARDNHVPACNFVYYLAKVW